MAISAAALPSSADLVNVATGLAPATATVSGASDPSAASARAAVQLPEPVPGPAGGTWRIDVEA